MTKLIQNDVKVNKTTKYIYIFTIQNRIILIVNKSEYNVEYKIKTRTKNGTWTEQFNLVHK